MCSHSSLKFTFGSEKQILSDHPSRHIHRKDSRLSALEVMQKQSKAGSNKESHSIESAIKGKSKLASLINETEFLQQRQIAVNQNEQLRSQEKWQR